MHQTVREFFRSDGPTAQSEFRMNSNDAHMRISITCVRYIMLCITHISSIDERVRRSSWKPENFEVCAEYLSRRPFFNYALGYTKPHLHECSQGAWSWKIISEFNAKLKESRAAGYLFWNWIPQAWLQRTATHEKLSYGIDFRAELLHTAARMKYSQVVEALLIAGAEVEACLDGKSLLMVTAENGDLATARVLLDRGALTEAKNENKQTSLHLAAANGYSLVAELLIDRGADKEGKDVKGQTPLHRAAANGHNPVARLLIDRGADKETKDNEDRTALHLAAANGHNPIIGLLVDRGANKDAKDSLGWGLLHTAAWNDHEATIEMLVKILDASKEERDVCGWTALHVAAMNGCGAASQCLIEHLGADREAKDKIGWTALHFVAALGLEETAQLLIKTFNVDRNARNNDGKTAQDLAQE